MFHVQYHKCKCSLESQFTKFLSNLYVFRLQRQLNNALQQAGIYSINMTIFGVEEAVDNFG